MNQRSSTDMQAFVPPIYDAKVGVHANELVKSDNVSDISKTDVEEHVHAQGASNASALFHVVCIIAGTGILQIPYSLTVAGWTGLIALCFSAFVNDYTGKMLVKCLYIDGKRIRGGLPEVGRIAFGPAGEYTVQFFYCTILVGVTCLYLVLCGDNFAELTNKWNGWDHKAWILVCAASLYLPFIFMRTLKEVAIVSLFGVITSFVVGFIVIVLGIIKLSNPDPTETVTYHVFDFAKFPMAMATYSFAYGGNYVYPEVEKTMKNPQMFPRMLTIAMTIVTVLYVATTAVGYAAYGNGVVSPILKNLDAGAAKMVAFILITIHSLLACPLLITTFSTGLERWLKIDAPQDTLRQWSIRTLLRTGIMIFVTAVAFLVPHFKSLMNLLGAVDNTMLIYFFPVIFYYKIHGFKGRSYTELGFAVFLMAMGLLCGSIGGYESIVDLIGDMRKDSH